MGEIDLSTFSVFGVGWRHRLVDHLEQVIGAEEEHAVICAVRGVAGGAGEARVSSRSGACASTPPGMTARARARSPVHLTVNSLIPNIFSDHAITN